MVRFVLITRTQVLGLLFSMLFLLPLMGYGQKNPESDQQKNDGKDHIRKAIRKNLHNFTDSEKTQFLKGKKSRKKGNENQITNPSHVESEVHAAINPTNPDNLIASPIRFKEGGSLITPIYYSKDQGQTWNESNFEAVPEESEGNAGGGDPVLAYDDNGTAYLTWLSLHWQMDTLNGQVDSTRKIGLYWAYSNDGGASWTLPDSHTIEEGDIRNLQVFYDKQWVAVDQNPNSPYYNNLYTSYTVLKTNSYEIRLKKKKGGTGEFEDSSTLISDASFSIVQFSDLSVDKEGNVHCIFFGSKNGSDFGIYHSISKDGGQNFNSPEKVADAQVPNFSNGSQSDGIEGIRQDRLYPCPHISVDQSSNDETSGNIYLTWTAQGLDDKQTDGTDIYFTRSTDQGESWESVKKINNPQNPDIHQFYPTISVNPQGKVVVAWYDRRKDETNNIRTEYYMAYSQNGGASFKGHHAITAVPTDFSTVGQRNNGFGIGEYTKVVSSKNYAIPFWADGRDSTGRLNIMTAKVPFDNFISSGSEFASLNKNFKVEGPYPNPVKGTSSLTVSTSKNAGLNIVIIDNNGKIIKRVAKGETIRNNRTYRLNLQNLERGIYYCTVQSNNGQVTKPFEIVR